MTKETVLILFRKLERPWPLQRILLKGEQKQNIKQSSYKRNQKQEASNSTCLIS